MLVCDCDNVAADGDNFGIGMPGFALEVVRGIAKPDVLTDRYSLAVVLFKHFSSVGIIEGSRYFSVSL